MRRLPLVVLLACGPPAPRGDDTDAPADTDVPDTDANDPFAGWGPPAEVSLRLNDVAPPEIVLDLDRDQVADLFGDAAEDVVLLELDPIPLLTGTLDRIKEACGTDWRRDVPDPHYDCDATELGRTFRGRDGTWRSSPEFALVRILTMTPANADVDGTSVATLAGIADLLDLGGGFGQILANALELRRTEEFLDTAPIAEALRTELLGTHPALRADGRIPVTLEDALTDLATLGPRVGPSGSHPGVLDPAFPTHGEVLGPDFRMHAVVRSNLRVLDGVVLGQGKDYVGVVVDTTGPTLDDEVEFDFADPARFSLTGLAEHPTVDLRLAVFEHDRFVPACGGTARGRDCRDNLPGQPVGTSTVWNLPPWDLERLITAAGVVKYGALRHHQCWLGCFSIEVDIGGDDPPGFATFDVLLGIGDPPEPQYVWELVDEVAQVRLHDAGLGTRLAEGAADVAFTVEDVPVGLTGAEAAEAVRPVLEAQQGLVSDFLLGDHAKNDGPVDFFYRRTDDGQPTLFWVVDGDTPFPRHDAHPGFYADPELTVKASRTVLPGSTDTAHEKWRVPPGDSTLYAEGPDGRRYRLDVVAPDLAHPRAELFVVVRERAP